MKNTKQTPVSLKLIFGEIAVGQPIRFAYNDKNRCGIVEKIFDNAVCVKIDGIYKSFSFSKMRPLIEN